LAVPWDVVWGYFLARRKAELAAALPQWLDIWHELEALSALATFAYLNPQYTWPVVHGQADQNGGNGPIFAATALGHPLIHAEGKVHNDFTIRQMGQIVIITGSNMAGKSSFLRALGVNLVLAYAGSVVNATSLESGLFRLFTCIRVTDSIVDGFSYFYAEVRRLKALLDAFHQPNALPLFYLIDEIFRGTNNLERLLGSRAYIRALAGARGVGFIATHDLELAKLEGESPFIHNYHFREEVHDGRMVFDYILRPGPSPTTNALKIMRLEGLPVEE
jgi:DNA mismatch repair ATPase MutS